ncbi:MAG TPA: ornithine--oxo-acid transaminase [Candidatus Krumholzibacteria bacterium]|nr:ornithine--oxo-acid transaminase [Candidatus Krumholzibacteria bacterium]HPD71934.1 ornithine--oxo-acid transaminase [Candidatus Krumholzibacteria bacterium]HRY41133.1 ornithine--oxo-acid transaminase [Candidatus Krumholzibacteria bacterium]
MKTGKYIEIEDQFGAHNYHPLDIVVRKAEGVWVEDVDGKRYIDFLAAYSAVNQGHCHPRLLKALRAQAARVTLTSRAFRNDQLPHFCREICELTGFPRVLPMNSGAEAVETALKAARKWGEKVKGVPAGQGEIIACADNFHGRTITIVSFSTDEQYRDGFGPFTPGFKIIPYGDADALAAAINERTVAFLVEPIQGESGIVVPPAGFLARARRLCSQHNVLLICDEIQSGLGRTGKLFAYEWENVRPDGVIVGKALSGGFYPVSAFLSSDEVMSVFHPGDHGSTFGGNPLGMAVAREAMRVLVEEKLVERSAELGPWFMEKLAAIKSPSIVKVRGKGLWVGLVLDRKARPYCEALMQEGLLCKETHDTVIRFAPPLCITRKDLNLALRRVAKVFKKLDG